MAKETPLNQNVINKVELYAKQLEKAGIKTSNLLVFGSQSKGSYTTFSDIDLCVISPDFGVNRYDERVMLMKLRTADTANIEPHPYNQDDLDNPYDALAMEIQRYGQTISL